MLKKLDHPLEVSLDDRAALSLLRAACLELQSAKNLSFHTMITTSIERPKGSLIAVVLLTILLSTTNARANVYATNIRLNGGTTNAVVVQGGNAFISYILNEPATEGVIIEIKSGMGTLRTIILTNDLGTARGSNSVIWDV